MGCQQPIQPTTMKTFLLICAIAAFATALPTDDVDEVVPETNFAEEAVGGHWTKCTLGHGDCAKPTIYTGSRVHHCKTKKACQYKIKQVNGKMGTRTYCSKWDKSACWEWNGRFNQQAKVNIHMSRAKIPFCDKFDGKNEKRTLCRCKGKHQDWKGKGKPCFTGPNPKKTKYCYTKGSRAGKCEDLEYKQGKWSASEKLMGSCNDQGFAFASTCAYPPGTKRPVPKKKKVCVCHVKGYNKNELIHLEEGKGKVHGKVHYKVFDWHKPGRSAQVKSFHEITCAGCAKVVLHDNDHRGKDNKVMSCCGKKKCHFKAKGHIGPHGYDLRDDSAGLILFILVKKSTRGRYGF